MSGRESGGRVRRERRAAIAAAGLVALLVASAPAGAEPAPGPIAAGRQVFEQKGCVHCHAGGGDEARRIGPDLRRRAESWSDAMRFAGALWNHMPGMAAEMQARGIERPPISADEMGALTAYLFYVRFVGAPGDPRRGRELFDDRLCSHCHQLGGRGGAIGPRLDDLRDYWSASFLARALWNHGPAMAERMERLGLAQQRFQVEDAADLVAFLREGSGGAGALEAAYRESGRPRAGERLFRERGCAACHGVGGDGGGEGPDLAALGPAFGASELAGAFWNHGVAMRDRMTRRGLPFPTFSDAEIADLLAFLSFAQWAGTSGDPARGARHFEAKACATCHAGGAPGAAGPPPLAGSAASRSAAAWAAAMWNHPPAAAERPRFYGDEMRDLVEYLRGAKAPAEREPGT